MKLSILVNEGPYQHQASDSALQFTKAALEKGALIEKVTKRPRNIIPTPNPFFMRDAERKPMYFHFSFSESQLDRGR